MAGLTVKVRYADGVKIPIKEGVVDSSYNTKIITKMVGFSPGVLKLSNDNDDGIAIEVEQMNQITPPSPHLTLMLVVLKNNHAILVVSDKNSNGTIKGTTIEQQIRTYCNEENYMCHLCCALIKWSLMSTILSGEQFKETTWFKMP
jgi:hypothetical protein